MSLKKRTIESLQLTIDARKKNLTTDAKRDLVIVESPSKARTVGRFLGKNYVVLASMGHVRDLPKDWDVEDIDNNFQAPYVNTKKTLISEIKKAAKQAESVYLATDPDREGEAISWHLVEAAKLGDSKDLKRVVFHEITDAAVQEAFAHPRQIDMHLVNAQQARRVLDRGVGYKGSNFLWSKIPGGRRKGLSAGRVQSIALKIIVDREREIEAFKPQEYWVITADLQTQSTQDKHIFSASLKTIPGQKGKPVINNESAAMSIKDDLERAVYKVSNVTRREARQRTRPPFTTSTLQQQAARSFRYSASRTMRIAQSLYEGIVQQNSEPEGLITYMRTDSTNLAENALNEAEKFIVTKYGADYSSGPRRYRTKSKSAQEAHEAIRPTSIENTPEKLTPYLSSEQLRLYTMIWKRTIASQMTDAIVDNTGVDIKAIATNGKEYIVRATGSVIKFDGFRKLYIETKDEDSQNDDSAQLPSLQEGDSLEKQTINADQKFTQPPPRFTEANLIRFLEEQGIGRPSTWATIVGTIEKRQYVDREKSRFKPTPTGTAVSDLLTKHISSIMDTGFTAGIETKLDSIADGDQNWINMLKEFFEPFVKEISIAKEKADRVPSERLVQLSDEKCLGGDYLVIRQSRYGKFLGCGKFPECRVAISTRPGERASGEVTENWKVDWEAAMENCAIAHPEAAAIFAAAAEKKRGSRKQSKKRAKTKVKSGK
ncbi:MAG: type I DNA topoisomerase [SAR202 cluster bacterium]|nr:MAG: type I DNA topoisomerase [SAR202 cluster bacterium]